MKTLPNEFLIDFQSNAINPLLDKFKDWIDENYNGKYAFNHRYYGLVSNGCVCEENPKYKVISLEEWNDLLFGEQFEKGEEVLVKDNGDKEWIKAIFIAEYKDMYIVYVNYYLFRFNECKKKPSELDIKIEELKKLAEEKGVKLTIIAE